MNVTFLAIELIPLLIVGSLGPGLWLVGGLRWSPLEKLCGAFAASFIATYLAGFGLFCLGSNAGGYFIALTAFALMGCLGWRQMRLLLVHRQTRAVLLAFAIILAWDFVHLAIVRNYNGGTWSGDWYEHYERTRYFIHKGDVPDDFKYIGLYLLPSRPPMMNIIEAFYCNLVGTGFEAYSLVSLFLNAFAFVPCCLLLQRFVPPAWRGRQGVGILAILFMLNPSVLQNVTYTWTKAFSAAFVILGIAYHLRGIRRRDSSRILAAWLSLSAGFLVHYSAGPFLLAVGIHYTWMLLGRRRRLLEPVLAGIFASLFLFIWLAWSAGVFGWELTISSNTTASAASVQTWAQVIHKTLYNFFCSIVPHPLHLDELPPRTLRDIRDYFFTMSQTTLPMMIGVAGGIVAIWAAWRFLNRRHPRGKGAERQFWMILLPVTLIVGALTHPDENAFGVAHVTMQPLALMGITLVAGVISTLRPAFFFFVVMGTLTDYALGIFLHFNQEARVETIIPDRNAALLLQRENLLRTLNWAQREYAAKLLHHYTFWGDHWTGWNHFLQGMSIPLAAAALVVLFLLRQRLRRRHTLAVTLRRRILRI